MSSDPPDRPTRAAGGAGERGSPLGNGGEDVADERPGRGASAVQHPVEVLFPYPVSDVYDPETLASERGPVYTYRHSGTRELEGVVNWWLYAVIVGLLLWGVFYTLAYWGGPGPGLDYTVPL